MNDCWGASDLLGIRSPERIIGAARRVAARIEWCVDEPSSSADMIGMNLGMQVTLMKKSLLFAALVAAFVGAPAFAEGATKAPYIYTGLAPVPHDAADAEIAGLFDRWNATIATGDADKVTALYADDGVLEPTVSNQVRTTPAEIKDYFVKFLKLNPVAVINFREIRVLDSDSAIDTGVYTFSLTKDGKVEKVQARYTFVYKKVNGEWKIMNHHSSMMPESAS